MFQDELGGTRPDRLADVGPQERVLRHTVEQIGDISPVVLTLGVLEPQMVDQVVAVLKRFDTTIPEQIISVPKISWASRPLRVAVAATQMAGQ